MIKENFYTGEPTQGSPPSFGFGSSNMRMTYSDPNERMASLQQQINIPFQQQPYSPFSNTPVGNQGYNAQQGFQGYRGNPALQLLAQKNGFQNYGFPNNQNMFFVQPPQFQDRVIHVPGFNSIQDTMFDKDIELEAARLQNQMLDELEEADYERKKRIQGYFNNSYGTNYYGMPFMNSYADPQIIQKYRNIANEIRQEGINRRMDFNKKLSRIAHNYLNDDIEEEEINKIYEGYSYTQSAISQQEDAQYAQLKRMVPVSNQQVYQNHFNMVHNTMQALMGNSNDMNSFLQAQGLMQIAENLEEEMHARRDLSGMYNRDGFRRRIARAKLERGDEDKFPVLSNAATLLDDGTLSIQAPNFFGLNNNIDRHVVINNQMQQQLEENRRKFLESIYQEGALNYGRQE